MLCFSPSSRVPSKTTTCLNMGLPSSLNDADKLRTLKFWIDVVAEFVGMYFFVLFGTGSILNDGWQTGLTFDTVRVSLTFGLGIALMVTVRVSSLPAKVLMMIKK